MHVRYRCLAKGHAVTFAWKMSHLVTGQSGRYFKGYRSKHGQVRSCSSDRSGAGKSTLVSMIAAILDDPRSGPCLVDDSTCDSCGSAASRQHRDRDARALSVPHTGQPRTSRTAGPMRRVTRSSPRPEPPAPTISIQTYRNGYDTLIGERGIDPSGGEKQRLSIARCPAQRCPRIILDEPTSALDTQTESTLIEAMERLMHGRTTVIIAHRLSTVRKADRTVVLDEGTVLEIGSHHDLLETRAGPMRNYVVPCYAMRHTAEARHSKIQT